MEKAAPDKPNLMEETAKLARQHEQTLDPQRLNFHQFKEQPTRTQLQSPSGTSFCKHLELSDERKNRLHGSGPHRFH